VLSKEFQFLNLVLKEALVGVIGWNDVVWVGAVDIDDAYQTLCKSSDRRQVRPVVR
jgi:hypothetical protein